MVSISANNAVAVANSYNVLSICITIETLASILNDYTGIIYIQ